jgi:Cu/Zn superoxide dismutase
MRGRTDSSFSHRVMLGATVMAGGLLLAACTSSGSDSSSTPSSNAATTDEQSVVVQLKSLRESGQTGTATLTAQGDKTLVVLELQGQPDGSFEPAHVHVNYCANIDPTPQYFLTDSSEETDGGRLWVENGKASALIQVPLAALQEKQHAVNVHLSPTNLPHYVACGDIPGVGGATPPTATTEDLGTSD